MPSVAVWLLRRNEPNLERPYRAPRGTIVLGLIVAGVWVSTTVLGFEQFGLPTVIIGLGFAYVGAQFYGWRVWSDRRRAGLRGAVRSLHVKLTGAMVGVIALDGVGYLIAVNHLSHRNKALETVLEDIFVAVALLTISVGLVLPGMIAHAAGFADAAARLSRGMITELTTAMDALGRGDLDAARAVSDTTPVVVQSKDELGSMAANFNRMQIKLAGAAEALDGAREGLRTTRDRLQRNIAQQAAIAQLGERALEGAGLDELLNDATRTVADVLAVEIAAMFELDPDSGALGLRASVGLPTEVTSPTFARGHSSQAAYTLAVGTPVTVADWSNEPRFRPSRMLELVGARSGITVLIDGGTRPHGVLGDQSLRLRAFTADEVDFLHAMANVLADAVARSRSEAATLHAALHDPLTGLPNRALFADRLGVALAQARRTDKQVRLPCSSLTSTTSRWPTTAADMPSVTSSWLPSRRAG